jgi:hypothetical protein
MGERQVAAVTPTPQLETGSLSPAYQLTPRFIFKHLLFDDLTVVGSRFFAAIMYRCVTAK